MGKRGHSEEEILRVLREAESHIVWGPLRHVGNARPQISK